MEISVCTTNYNCAHALGRHLESVYRVLAGLEFEYIMVDNRSRDGSWDILRGWNSTHPNMRLISKRCTMGAGRQIAFDHSEGRFIVVLDTDVVYDPLLRLVVDRYLERYRSLAVHHACDAPTTWMIGNSPKSDINPALAAGLNAVFVPHGSTWVLEHEVLNEAPAGQRLLQLERLADLIHKF